jgi:hypothetical protein
VFAQRPVTGIYIQNLNLQHHIRIFILSMGTPFGSAHIGIKAFKNKKKSHILMT